MEYGMCYEYHVYIYVYVSSVKMIKASLLRNVGFPACIYLFNFYFILYLLFIIQQYPQKEAKNKKNHRGDLAAACVCA